MIKELLDGLKSRLKGVGEKGSEVPPAGGIPPASADTQPSDSGAPTMPPAPASEDFTALLGGGDTSELENKVKQLEDKTVKLESTVKETLEITKSNKQRLDSIDANMKKFISLYELVTNQINPFVDSRPPFQKAAFTNEPEAKTEPEPQEEKIIMPPAEELEKTEPPAPEPAAPAKPPLPEMQTFERQIKPEAKTKLPEDTEQVMFLQSIKDGSASFVLEWITSLISENGDIEKNTRLLRYLLNLGWITPKAYDALMQHVRTLSQARKTVQTPQRIPLAVGVPSGVTPGLPQIPGLPQMPPMPVTLSPANNVDSVVTVLEWVKYLVDKVGYDEASGILRYLVQLEWITPEAHDALLRYIEKTVPEVRPRVSTPSQLPQKPETRIVLTPSQIPSPAEFMRRDIQEYQIPIQPIPQMQYPMQPQPQPPRPYFQGLPYQQPTKPKAPAIIPLTELGSDIESLAIVLEWIRHLVDRAGIQGAKDIFNYYMNIGWVDQQVYQQLVKYVEGIKVSEEETVGYQPTIEDHATSLFFIGKLKRMDLTEEDIRSLLGK